MLLPALPPRRFLAAALVLALTFAGAPVFAREKTMYMQVADKEFELILANTQAARAFAALLPLELEMAELNGNEKYAQLPQSLPTNAHPPGRIEAGDVMLYGADTVVVFYESFRTGYRYTRIGRLREAPTLAQTLGRGSVTVRFAAQPQTAGE
ncbi:MAG: hypothetical protein IK051_08925 [Rhodocyclaceae bacterium]|nr:hypothetical protein [Rhodocyclaceae bacterium]